MKRYLSLHVYTKNLMEIAELKYRFGGNSYRHSYSIWAWRLSKKEDLLKVAEEVLKECVECPEPLLPLIEFYRSPR